MKFQIERDALKRALERVVPATTERYSEKMKDLCAHILLEADGESVTLTGTNLELGSVLTLEADVEKAGRGCVLAAALQDYAKATEEEEITLALEDNNWWRVSAGSASARMRGVHPDDMPMVEVPAEPVECVTIDGETLVAMLEATSGYVARGNDARMEFTGVALRFGPGGAVARATDSARGALVDVDGSFFGAGPWLVSGSVVRDLTSLVDVERDVTVWSNGSKMFLSQSGWNGVAELVQAEPPDLEQTVVRTRELDDRVVVQVERGDLARSLRLLKPFEGKERKILLTVTADSLTLESSTPRLGDGKDAIKACVDTEDTHRSILVDQSFLATVVKGLHGEHITLEWCDFRTPLVASDDECGRTFVIMPFRPAAGKEAA